MLVKMRYIFRPLELFFKETGILVNPVYSIWFDLQKSSIWLKFTLWYLILMSREASDCGLPSYEMLPNHRKVQNIFFLKRNE